MRKSIFFRTCKKRYIFIIFIFCPRVLLKQDDKIFELCNMQTPFCDAAVVKSSVILLHRLGPGPGPGNGKK
jgi:hypothetical protein